MSRSRTFERLFLTIVVSGCTCLTSCGSGPEELSNTPTPEDQHAAQLAQSAHEQAQRLKQAMQHQATDSESTHLPHIHWIDNSAQDPLLKAQVTGVVSVEPLEPIEPQQPAVSPVVITTIDEPINELQPLSNAPAEAISITPVLAHDPLTNSQLSMERQGLLQAMRLQVRSSNDASMLRALAAAGLSLVTPDRKLASADLADLNESQRELVAWYHRELLRFADDFYLQQAPIVSAADAVETSVETQAQPVTIRKIVLCRRVHSYGVYEPFEDHSFLAGREQSLIVYVELDHFKAQRNEHGHYQVKLSQEVVLYTESDGLAVWRQPVVEVLDESRNERRDFFTVQLIRLPPRLSVGKYLLKVTINDANSQTVGEQQIPLQVVAQQALTTIGK